MDPLNKKLLSLSEISKQILKKVLNNCVGNKYLILQPSIIRPLERICGVKWLKENNVEKLYKLESNTQRIFDEKVVQVYMIFCDIIIFKQVLDQINLTVSKYTNVSLIPQNKYHIVVVPRVSHSYEVLLEQFGLYDIVTLHSFQWLPMQMDVNTISLEFNSFFKTIYIKNDYFPLPVLSNSLWQLFCVTGKPKYSIALGKHSNAVLKQVDILSEELGNSTHLECDFGAVIIMDRSMDYASALLTPVTYTGLINEIYNIKCGVVESKEKTGQKYDEKFNPVTEIDSVTLSLNSNDDSVYAKIKHRHFSEVTSILSELTKELRSEGETSKDMEVEEMKTYVKTKLQKLTVQKKNLANHLLVAETIINILGHKFEKLQHTESSLIQNKNKSSNYAYIEETLCMDNDKYSSLRLICLMALTQKLSYDEMKNLKQKYLHEFGHRYLYTFHNLKTAGFFVQPVASKLPNLLPNLVSVNNFYNAASKLRQVPAEPEKVSLKAPTCCSYVFGGFYVPLCVQLINMVVHGSPVQEMKTKLELIGPLTIVSKQQTNFQLQPRTVLLNIVGGVTYAEIAACHLLESLTSCKIVVMSDCILSGKTIMEAAM